MVESMKVVGGYTDAGCIVCFLQKYLCALYLNIYVMYVHLQVTHGQCDLGWMRPFSPEARVHVIQMKSATQLFHPGGEVDGRACANTKDRG